MIYDWSPLRKELATCRAEALPLPIWWRDDDAVSDTAALGRLTDLSQTLGLPVHLAVIPALAQPTLTKAIATQPALIPVVHGWAHKNHALSGQKKAEFGHPRDAARGELQTARKTLETMFGERLLAMFVPPWNRMDPSYDALLLTLGYRAVSTFTPRVTVHPVPGLIQINTHLDPINWRGDRGLAPPQDLIAQVVTNLQKRRMGDIDATEPLGYLTHHLVHTPEVWSFSKALISELLDGGAYPADIGSLVSEST